MRPWVVKIGGRLCEDASIRAQFAAACAQFVGPLVIVHGGGAQVTRLQEAMGISAVFNHGRRVTQASDMALVEMALSGGVNKALVRALHAAGKKAVGVSGCDGAMVVCRLVPELGAVGEPQAVNAELLSCLVDSYVPVISPVSLGPLQEAVNVNADEFACAIAMALKAERLLLLSDVSGVKVEGEDQKALADSDVEALIAAGIVTGGMVPKLRSAVRAINAGVQEVCIAGFHQGSLKDVQGTTVFAKGKSGV
jgi:acetylglutamate kinase